MITIGDTKIDSKVLLAPLSACSDLAFRLIAREYGAKFCFFEMMDSNSLDHDTPRSDRILRTCPEDQPIAAQLLGTDADTMLHAAEKIIQRVPIAFLDINAACPARKVLKKCAGAHFFKVPDLLYRVIDRLVRALPVPITVKMRVGLNQVDIPAATEFAKGCETAGASAIFVHGRTRSQKNVGEINYEAIKAVKDAVRIPVVGSGNILNPPLAKKMLDQTGCDGVLVAKGSFGNPFIYREIEEYLETGKWTPRTNIKEKLLALKKHILKAREIEGDRLNLRIGALCKICLWYLKGFNEASRMRSRIFLSKNEQELLGLVDGLLVQY